jgi:hypothetical protein
MLLDGSGPLFAEFDTRYLLAGSTTDRAQWARTMVEMGIYTRNEIRDNEGLDPLPGLDEPLTPLNMTQGNEPADELKEPEDDAQAKQIEVLERKLYVLESRQQPSPSMNIELRTGDIERSVKSAIDTMAQAHADHIKSIAAEMPINIKMPDQAAPVVNVTVEPTPIVFEATVPQAQVIVNNTHPSSAVQTVQRDSNDEIVSTTTVYQ